MEKQVCWKTSFQHDKPSTFTLTRWHLLLLSCKWLTTGWPTQNTSSSRKGRGRGEAMSEFSPISTSGKITYNFIIHKNSKPINQIVSVSWCYHRVRATTTVSFVWSLPTSTARRLLGASFLPTSAKGRNWFLFKYWMREDQAILKPILKSSDKSVQQVK